jgi:DnaJ-class molecular chaperone
VIDVPKKLTSEQEELLRKYAATEKSVALKPSGRSFLEKLKDLFSE